MAIPHDVVVKPPFTARVKKTPSGQIGQIGQFFTIFWDFRLFWGYPQVFLVQKSI